MNPGWLPFQIVTRYYFVSPRFPFTEVREEGSLGNAKLPDGGSC